MKRYNSSVEILRQNGHQMFVDLTWEKASDVSSSIYTTNIASEDEIPLSLKRTAVDIINLINRLLEEQRYLNREMETCVNTFYHACLDIENVSITFEAMEGSPEECDVFKGLYCLKKNELHYERINLSVACNIFKHYIKIPDEVVEYLQQHSELSEEIRDNHIEDESDDEPSDDEQSEENE
jgi:hypothetical protein